MHSGGAQIARRSLRQGALITRSSTHSKTPQLDKVTPITATSMRKSRFVMPKRLTPMRRRFNRGRGIGQKFTRLICRRYAPAIMGAGSQSGRKIGIRITVTIIATMVKGTPTFTKSPNPYWPGPTTNVFTGEEMGVMKAEEAAIATTMTNG